MNTLARITGLALGLVLFAPLWLAPLAIGIALDEGPVLPEPVEVGTWMTGKSFAFTWDGLNRDGAQHQAAITTVVFRFSVPGGDAVAWSIISLPAPAVPGLITVPLSQAIGHAHDAQGAPLAHAGQRLSLEAKLRSTVGEGSYSPALLVKVVPEPPPAERPTTTSAPTVVDTPEEE